MANGAIAKYSYFVILFELGTVGLFTFLYFYNEKDVDLECVQTFPLDIWWIVSLTVAYFACGIGFSCAISKEIADCYEAKRKQEYDYE